MRAPGLHTKTILTLILFVLPIVTLFTAQRISSEQNTRHTQRIERSITRLDANIDNLCTRARVTSRRLTRRLPKGSTLTIYDADMRRFAGHKNQLTTSQKQQLRDIETEDIQHFPHASSLTPRRTQSTAPNGYSLAALQSNNPKCSYLMLTWPPLKRSLTRDVLRVVLPQTIFLTLILLASGLLISIPLVRRIRRLTHDVESSSTQNQWTLSNVDAYGKDELGQLAHAFNAAGHEIHNKIHDLETRDATLKEYIANTTHDLAIPLTVIQHRLRRIQRAIHDDTAIEQEWVDGAMEESLYIAALIANMAAMAKLDSGQNHITTHEVNLSEVITRIISRHQPIAEPQRIELVWSTPEEPITIQGDSTLIERAISNLVQNAIQYNDPGGHVAVILEHLSNHRFELSIKDDGPGVPAKQLETLGTRAARSDDARNRNPGGQGFGLSITQKVCDLHDWSITFASPTDDAGTPQGLHISLMGKTTS